MESLTDFFDEGILNCTQCDLCKYEVNRDSGKMLGFGSYGATMIIGQNPSYKRRTERYAMSPSDVEGTPEFLLWKVLKEVKFPTKYVYVTNFLKCSTPENRPPTNSEIKACYTNWLSQEITICHPTLIVCLGKNTREMLDSFSTPISIIKDNVFHHSFIARNKSKYDEWRNQWLDVKSFLS